MISGAVFGSVGRYLKSLGRGAASALRAVRTSAPYLVGWGEHRKEITEQYPDPVSSRTEDDLPPRTRGLLFNDIERCTGCLACAKVCPVNCIEIQNEPGPDAEKKWVAVFNIDFSTCIFCGLCVESCQPTSLIHTKQYEGSVYRLTDLKVGFGRGHVTQEQRDKWETLRKSQDFVF